MHKSEVMIDEIILITLIVFILWIGYILTHGRSNHVERTWDAREVCQAHKEDYLCIILAEYSGGAQPELVERILAKYGGEL